MVRYYYKVKQEKINSSKSKLPDFLSKYRFIQILTDPTNSEALIVSNKDFSVRGVTKLTERDAIALTKLWHPQKLITNETQDGGELSVKEFDLKRRFRRIRWPQ